MFIKEVKKSNTPNGKVFRQYQLSETYRVNKKVKHKAILYLGYHKIMEDKQNRAVIAKLLESKIKNEQALSEGFDSIPSEIHQLAEQLYRKYLQKNQAEEMQQQAGPEEDLTEYEEVDLNTTQVFDAREIGAESMSYEVLKRSGLKEFLKRKGWRERDINLALISMIARAVASYSEHKTEVWLRSNSGLTELFGKGAGEVSRYDLYRISRKLYSIKEELEGYFYNTMTTMFGLKDSILIYDLTNTYFEGRKLRSRIARYGRSKEKRNDCKQVVLAAIINEDGFLKHSNIYAGNMSDPLTLIDIIVKMGRNGGEGEEKRKLIVIDAGIASEENLEMLRTKGYLYVCVSRSKPKKDYKTELEEAVTIKDKRGNEIRLKYMETPGSKDRWLYVKSSTKTRKEDSMTGRAMESFEKEMESVKSGISKKGGTKKADKVWERIGRIKERNKSVHKYYDIKVEAKDGTAVKVSYERKEAKPDERASGEYYLRTNHIVKEEKEIWDIYNTIREVEAAFRCLKSDLRLRPIHHQKDINSEAHLHLGLLSYQIVAPVRYMLKEQGIDYGWANIVRIMNTQKAVSVSIKRKDKNHVTIRSCTRPTHEVLEIYQALKMSSMPFGNKKFVVHH